MSLSSKKLDGKDALGARAKRYERAFKAYIPERVPLILRFDGRGFSALTSKLTKPFDDKFMNLMNETALYLCKEISGASFGYVQSDEISILVNNYLEKDSEPFFDNQVQKIISITAGMASAYFSLNSLSVFGETKLVCFDARLFVVPEWEVNSMFWWRQSDNIRNSVQMLAHSLYSHKQLEKKNSVALKELCVARGKPWEDLPLRYQRGRCFYKKDLEVEGLNKKTGEIVKSIRHKWVVDESPPLFCKEKVFIEKHVLRAVVNPDLAVLQAVDGEAHETNSISVETKPCQDP
jgi:tRNA(His) guanylyltransferase